MNMNEWGLIKNFTAEGAIEPRRMVTLGASEGTVKQAVAASDVMLGLSGIAGGSDKGRIDVYLDGIRDIVYGDVVAYGDPLTTDADGRAIKAKAGDQALGLALSAGKAGTIGTVFIQRHTV